MSLYDERLARDLEQIRGAVAAMATQIEGGLQKALQALRQKDHALANEAILGDLAINRASRALDRKCHYFIARHLPSAGHLRYISSVMRVNVALERIGDYAVSIAREVVQLSQPLEGRLLREAENLAEHAFEMLHQAIQAFDARNDELARGTMGMAAQVDREMSAAFEDLVAAGREGRHKVKDLFATLIIFNRLERVSDQAKNICEETVFAVTGETKKPKVYRILFVEAADEVCGPMAVAMARKAYPEQGNYQSAGLHPAAAVRAEVAAFLADNGYDLAGYAPEALVQTAGALDDFHVIVNLDATAAAAFSETPYHTTVLHWNLPALPPPDASEEVQRVGYEALYKALATHLRDLMDTLHGEEAP